MHSHLITAPDAAKLPRAALLLLCVLYIVPGLIGRDPWTTDDAIGLGIAHTMAIGVWADWLRPNVAGLAMFDEGPLAYWIGALFVRLLPFLEANLAVRLAAVAWLALAFTCVWYALYALASRPDAQPADPFGASPSRTDFGRAVADAGLLILLATVGPIARVHETTDEALQFALAAVFLFGIVHALRAPVAGGGLAGLAIGATVLAAGGLPVAAALLMAGIVLSLLVRPYRLQATVLLPSLILSAIAVGGIWPLLLAASGPAGADHLSRWLDWNVRPLTAPGHLQALRFIGKTAPWYFWPAWPIAAFAPIAWRGRLTEPAVAVPLVTIATTGALIVAESEASLGALLPIAPAMAMLAGVSLPMLSRRLLSLIDWFAVAAFSVFCIAMWAYWIAYQTGTPPRMAASIVRLAPGLTTRSVPLGVAFALAATLGWLLLVRWRVSRQPRALWRTVVLSAGGFVLAWALLMTLWMPVFNYRKSHRDVAQQIAAIVPADHRCVHADGLPPAARAAFAYFAQLRFARTPDEAARCEWLLHGDRVGARLAAPPATAWTPVWEGRRATDRNERYRLYRRTR